MMRNLLGGLSGKRSSNSSADSVQAISSYSGTVERSHASCASRLLGILLMLAAIGTASASGVRATEDEVWSEGGLRLAGKSVQASVGDRGIRVQLAAGTRQVTVEAATFTMTCPSRSGLMIKSVGPATVATSKGRTMYAGSVEVWVTRDGWGYFKAVRRVTRR